MSASADAEDAMTVSLGRTPLDVRPTTCGQLYVYTPPALCVARSSQIASYTPRNEVAAANAVEEAFHERLALRKRSAAATSAYCRAWCSSR